MGCGVAGLAGLSCDWIPVIFWGFVAIVVALLLFAVSRFSHEARKKRNVLIAGSIVAALIGYAWMSGTIEESGRVDRIRAEMEAFQGLCHEKAYERITRRATNLSELRVTPPSGIKDERGDELFYGVFEPSRWTARKVATSRSPEPDRDNPDPEGRFELRIEHLLETRAIHGTPRQFHGVRQQVVHSSSGEVTAERVNYAWSTYRFLGGACLGVFDMLDPWHGGNDEFLDRAIGPKYGSASSRSETTLDVRFRKSRLLQSSDVSTELPDDLVPRDPSIVLFDGVQYCVHVGSQNRYRDPKCDPGARSDPRVAAYLADRAPNWTVSMSRHGTGYVVVALPVTAHNRPALHILFVFLDADLSEVQRTYAQLPAGLDWRNGWGFDPRDVQASANEIRFVLYGKKRWTGKYSDQPNAGRYSKRYEYAVQL